MDYYTTAIKILQLLGMAKIDFKTIDLDVKFTRNKNDNLQTKAQSFSTLHGTKTLDPADALEICDMTTDVVEVIDRGKKYWQDVAEQNLELQKKTQEVLQSNNNQNQNQNQNKAKENTGKQDYNDSDGVLNPSSFRYFSPSKLLRFNIHSVTIRILSSLKIQLPKNQWTGFSFYTNFIKYSDRYHIYTLGHILI